MDDISTALSMIIAVSVAVERVTEILKQMFPWIGAENTDPRKENWRRAGLQVLAAVIGTIIAAYGHLQLGSHGGRSTYGLIGLLSSGGSAFWNHALDAMRAMKIDKEAQANARVAGQGAH